jgi:hypothetical protein
MTMPPDDMQATPARLAFGTTFSDAFSVVFGRMGQFVRMATVPLLLSIAILLIDFSLRALIVVGTLPLDPEGLAAVMLQLVTGLLALLPFTFLGIALTRTRCLGPQSGLLPGPLLGRRTFIYAGYFLLLSVAFVLVAAIAIVAAVATLQATGLGEAIGPGPLILGSIAGLCLLFYLLLRFSLVLPAVALDEKLGLGGSWRLTRRGGVKLLGVFLLLFLVNVLAVLVGSMMLGGGKIHLGTPELIIPETIGAETDWVTIVVANMPRNIWNLIANFIIVAMSIGALTSAYTQLSGLGKPREEILERFE